MEHFLLLKLVNRFLDSCMVRLLTKSPKITVFKSFKLRAQSSLSIVDLSRPQSLRYFCPADGATDVSDPRRCTKGSRPLGTRLIEDWCREENKQTKLTKKRAKLYLLDPSKQFSAP